MYKIYVKGAKNCVAIVQLSSVKDLLTLPICVVSEYLPKTSVYRNNPPKIFALPLPSKSSI